MCQNNRHDTLKLLETPLPEGKYAPIGESAVVALERETRLPLPFDRLQGPYLAESVTTGPSDRDDQILTHTGGRVEQARQTGGLAYTPYVPCHWAPEGRGRHQL